MAEMVRATQMPTATAAGWYLLECPELRVFSPLFLSGTTLDGGEFRIRVDKAGRGTRVVVILARPVAGLHLQSATGPVAAAFTMRTLSRAEAALHMLNGLRRSDGARDWMRLARTLAAMAVRSIRGGAGDVLVGAYHGLDCTAAQPISLRTGIVARRAELEPIDQLKVIACDGHGVEWETDGDDPKFRLASAGRPVGLTPGWYIFRGRFVRREGLLVAPCLYPSYRVRTGEAELISLPEPDDRGLIETLVLLPYPVLELRFDPTIRRAKFTASGVSLVKISRARALWWMLRMSGQNGMRSLPATLSALFDFARNARSVGVSSAASLLHRQYLQAQRAKCSAYGAWVRRFDGDDAIDSASLARRASRLVGGPLISVLLPVYETPERWLRRCIESVIAQAYRNWELCIADDGSSSTHVRRLLEEYAARDPRIRIAYRQTNGHISEASNTALAMARGEYVGLLDHDDELRPHALLEVAEAIASAPDLELIYTDEDKVDEDGRRFDPYFKPDWNYDLLLGQNYVCHFTVMRTSRVRGVGGFRVGFEGSQDHDLVLRCVRGLDAGKIRHIPRVLYHWRAIPGSTAMTRDAKDYASLAGARAVSEHVAGECPEARVEILEQGHYRVRWPLPAPAPRVSMVVPTRDRVELLRTCIESLLSRTRYPDFEILVVDNQSADPEALAYLNALRGHDRIRVLHYDAPFNYSAINNFAVAQATGSVLALINNDIEVIAEDWLEEMVSQAMRPGVGAVGAMLYYPNGTIQHAGVILGLGGIANHAYVGDPAGIPGHGGRARVVQEMSAVTGACLVVRKDLYQQVGGLDERLQVAFNDIDFCLRLRQAGYRNLWTPFATLYHHESASRGRDDDGPKRERFMAEVALMQERWGDRLEQDPAYNPNLTLSGKAFDLADPPRV